MVEVGVNKRSSIDAGRQARSSGCRWDLRPAQEALSIRLSKVDGFLYGGIGAAAKLSQKTGADVDSRCTERLKQTAQQTELALPRE